MSDEKPKLIESYCKGCGYCIEFCPKDVFEESDELNERGVKIPKIREEVECIRCGLCTVLCPEMAIFFEEEEDEDE